MAKIIRTGYLVIKDDFPTKHLQSTILKIKDFIDYSNQANEVNISPHLMIYEQSGNKEKDTLVERAILVNGIGTTIIPPRENLDYNAIQNLKLSYISLMEPNVVILLVNELDAKSLLKEDKEIVEKLKIDYPVIISSYESIIASYGV